jgi:hypothetical protein
MFGYYTNEVDKDGYDVDRKDSIVCFDINRITKAIYPDGLD